MMIPSQNHLHDYENRMRLVRVYHSIGSADPNSKPSMSTVEKASITESSRMASTVVKRKLRFSLESNQVFPIKHITDMNEEDKHNIWYTEGDFTNDFRLYSVLHQRDRGDKRTESNTVTERGLEWRTHQGALRHEHNKLMARHAVLNEQHRQFLDGEQDDELVADAYLNVSSHCCHEAYWMGLKDEAAIRKKLNAQYRKFLSGKREDELAADVSLCASMQ
jgi:hypothetical protein